MAPDNFDNNIKNKLENRTIIPSDKAWSKLSEQLDTLDRKKSNNMVWWLGIAASIVGVLFFILGNNENSLENTTPIVVDTEHETKIENSDEELPIIKNNDVLLDIEKSQPLVSTKNQATPKIKESKNQPQQNTIIAENKTANTNEVVAEVAQEPKLESEQSIQMEPNDMSFEDQKIQEVVAQIQNLERQDKDISEEEIDQLLQQAESQIDKKQLYNQSTKTVDANSLLQDVEMELEQSFRDKVLEALKSGYETVKVAVIQRNE